MPCIDLPKSPLPVLPSPFTIPAPTLTTPQNPLGGIPLCCNISIPSSDTFSTPPVALPIGVVLLPIVELFTEAIGEITGFLASLEPSCPLNSSP